MCLKLKTKAKVHDGARQHVLILGSTLGLCVCSHCRVYMSEMAATPRFTLGGGSADSRGLARSGIVIGPKTANTLCQDQGLKAP
jgi:hypothetical protein